MLPKFIIVQQKRSASAPLADPEAALRSAVSRVQPELAQMSGKKVGIAVGSRGIDRIPEIVRSMVAVVKEAGGNPEIFAAMGCHGDASAVGQREVLASLGVTEEAIGAPVACSNICRPYGTTVSGFPVFGNILPFSYDNIILINRVKPHTDFSDTTESGLLKMLAIGVGNPRGCKNVHTLALRHGYGPVIRETAALMLEKLPVSFGLMLTENWKHQLDHMEAVRPEEFVARETQLLAAVKAQMTKLPATHLDALLVENIGKDISGTCMDTKVIGRICIIGQEEPEFPRIKRIVVHNLTDASHGNAIGLGLADYTTQRVLEKVNIHATVLNSVSSMAPESGRIPCVMENDYEAICAAVDTIGLAEREQAHCIFIRDTNALEFLAVSEALYRDELAEDPHIIPVSQPFSLEFDDNGYLLSKWRGNTVS